MKITSIFLTVSFALCAVTQGQDAVNFAELRAEYGQARERIAAAEKKKLKQLKEKYAQALDKGIVYYMRKGDLDSTLALRDERERFQEESSMPPPPETDGAEAGQTPRVHEGQAVAWKDVDDGVVRTIRRCREHWQTINRKADRQRLELNQYYAEKLAPLERRLTRQGRLEEALAVSKERRQVAARVRQLEAELPTEDPESRDADEQEQWDPEEQWGEGLPASLRSRVAAYFAVRREMIAGRDSGPANAHAKVRGTTWREDGPRGGYLEFDGEDDLLELPPGAISKALDGAKAISFSMWIRPDALPETLPHQSPVVMSVGRRTDGSALAVTVNSLHTSMGGRHGADGEYVKALAAPLEVAQWQHLAGTIDLSGGRVKVYLNGRRVAGLTAEMAEKSYSHEQAGQEPDALGGVHGNPERRFRGALDEVAVIRGELSSADLRALSKR